MTVAISPAGRWLAARAIDEPALHLIDLENAAPPRRLPCRAAGFAITDSYVWSLDGETLECTPIGAQDHDPRLLSIGGRRITVVGGDAVAVTDGCKPTLITVEAGRLCPAESRFPVGTPVFPLSGGRLLAPGPRGLIVFDLLRSTPLFPVQVTSGTTIVGAVAGGDRVVLLARRPDADALIYLAPDGRVTATVPLPRTTAVALAGSGGVVLAASERELVWIDVATGSRRSRLLEGLRITDLACSDDGAIAAIVERRPDGSADLLYGAADDVIAGAVVPASELPSASPTEAIAADDAAWSETAASEPPLDDAPPPEVAFRTWRGAEPAAPHDDAAANAVVAAAIRHAAELLDRLLFLGRNVGLLPRFASADDPLAQLAISDDDVATLFASLRTGERGAAASTPAIDASRAALRVAIAAPGVARLGLARIVEAFALSDAAVDQLVLALAPDLDLRLGRVCGFLNNDPSVRRPRIGHLQMVTGRPCSDLLERRLIETLDDDHAPLDGQLVRVPRFLAGLATQPIEAGDARSITWSDLRLGDGVAQRLGATLTRELTRPTGLRTIVLEGLPGSGRLSVASAAAREAGLAVEACDLDASATDTRARLSNLLEQAAYRAKLRAALLVVRSDGVLGRVPELLSVLTRQTAALDVPCCLLVRIAELEAIDGGARFVRVPVPRLGARERRLLWRDALRDRQVTVSAADLDDAAVRYSTVTAGRIVELASELQLRAAWERRSRMEIGDVRMALREITVERLSGLATRYDSAIRLDDLVLPIAVRDRLSELVHRLRFRQRVLAEWDFGDKAHQSFGVSTLFSGPAGTGKTAAAAAIANQLEIDLYVVNVASIMSKWVGETEQNLARVFDEAEASNVALLFDEADSLFGKRSSEQKSSSDRYANLTINYLLTRMESFSGLAILTTNLESAIDDAFQRRITTRIRFPASDPPQRQTLWRHLLPSGARFGEDVDLEALAAEFALEGAHIQRALARAAFHAAAEHRAECVLTQADLKRAALAEYEDMGRLAHDARELELANRRAAADAAAAAAARRPAARDRRGS